MTIELEIMVMAGVAIGLVCAALGYWWATASQRRAAGGKSVTELSAEKAQYEENVVEHFKETADLLNEMTDKYRDVYRHMAEGAQRLVPGENVTPALAALQSGLLAAPGGTPPEGMTEPSSQSALEDYAAGENADDTSINEEADSEVVAKQEHGSTDLKESPRPPHENEELTAQSEEMPVVPNAELGVSNTSVSVNEQPISEEIVGSDGEDVEHRDFFANDTTLASNADGKAPGDTGSSQEDVGQKDKRD